MMMMMMLFSDRNDVWRYQDWPGVSRSFARTVFRGCMLASALMVVTIAADKMFGLKRNQHLPPNTKYDGRLEYPHDEHSAHH